MEKQTKADAAPLKEADEILRLALSLNMARDKDEILLRLRDDILAFTKAEKVTIYALDPRTGELFSKVKVKDEIDEVRIPVSEKSIAGYAAKTGRLVNMADAYEELEKKRYPGLQFDKSWDRKSGYRTRAVLAAPISYEESGLLGAIQFVHSKPGRRFTAKDEETITDLAKCLAVAFFNLDRVVRKTTRFDLLLERNAISPEELNRMRRRNNPVSSGPDATYGKEFYQQCASIADRTLYLMSPTSRPQLSG